MINDMTLVNFRFLNVKYHQASVGKFKKVAAVSTIAFVLIIVMVLTFGSTPTKKIAIKLSGTNGVSFHT